MKNLILPILFLIIAGIMTQPKTRNSNPESLHLLLNEKTGAQVHILQEDVGAPFFLTLKNMSKEFSLKGLRRFKSLEFKLEAKNCPFATRGESFYCISPNDETPIATQRLKTGGEIHLLGFSSYPFKGKVFNSQSGEFEEQTIYKTSLKLQRGSRFFTFDFHTSKRNWQRSHQAAPLVLVKSLGL